VPPVGTPEARRHVQQLRRNTSIRLNGIDPVAEDATTPGLRARIVDGGRDRCAGQPGEVLIPDLIARGMKVKVGDTVVLVATNGTARSTARTSPCAPCWSPSPAPAGATATSTIDDARELLRMDKPEAMELPSACAMIWPRCDRVKHRCKPRLGE
jgi:putative ABC transport system permease protein